MLCANGAFALVLPLLLAVLLALNSVHSGSCQSQVPSQPIASVCSLDWSAVYLALARRLILLSNVQDSDGDGP